MAKSEALLEAYARSAREAGCPDDQVLNFARADLVLHPRQLLASAAARGCDSPVGPTEIGFGGARGGGKSFWLLAQMGADDCQRFPDLKCLLLRRVGKANIEHFEDLRRTVFSRLAHEFVAHRGVLTFENGSKILAGHFQNESDIDAYLGLEYDVVGVEEATTLSASKYEQIRTCCRSSKWWRGASWRPRIYSNANPGGVGHAFYKERFIDPFRNKRETETRFIPSLCADNPYNNAEYATTLGKLAGWQRRAWLDGDWDIQAGQYFTNFRSDVHVIDHFDRARAVEWFAAIDYGFTHYTVCLLGCRDGDGNTYVVDEHAGRMLLPELHAGAIKAMLKAYSLRPGHLMYFVGGADMFSRESNGRSISDEYRRLGIPLRPANMERVQGWAKIMGLLGSVGVKPKLFIHRRCARLIETLPVLQRNPNRPEDVLKVDADDEGRGGDDAADCLRYLVSRGAVSVGAVVG